jgi:hypothetical protein
MPFPFGLLRSVLCLFGNVLEAYFFSFFVLISSRGGLLQAVMHLTCKHSPFAHQIYDTFISTCFAQLFCDVPGISHLICFAFLIKQC